MARTLSPFRCSIQLNRYPHWPPSSQKVDLHVRLRTNLYPAGKQKYVNKFDREAVDLHQGRTRDPVSEEEENGWVGKFTVR